MLYLNILKLIFLALMTLQFQSKPTSSPNPDNHPEIPKMPSNQPLQTLSEAKNTVALKPKIVDSKAPLNPDCTLISACDTCSWQQINEHSMCNDSGYIQTFDCKNLGKMTRPCNATSKITNFTIFSTVIAF
jgi:hypothetical protein